jgi:hypothetical protein
MIRALLLLKSFIFRNIKMMILNLMSRIYRI